MLLTLLFTTGYRATVELRCFETIHAKASRQRESVFVPRCSLNITTSGLVSLNDYLITLRIHRI